MNYHAPAPRHLFWPSAILPCVLQGNQQEPDARLAFEDVQQPSSRLLCRYRCTCPDTSRAAEPTQLREPSSATRPCITTSQSWKVHDVFDCTMRRQLYSFAKTGDNLNHSASVYHGMACITLQAMRMRLNL